MYNVKDIPKLENKIRLAIEAEGTDETPGIEHMINDIACPNTGLIYKPGENGKVGHLVIANGWKMDDNGNIVRYEPGYR